MKGTLIELGGKERRLRYDLNAVAEIGDRLGLKIRLAHVKDDLMEKELSLSAFRTVIWAGLIHEDPELAEQQVGAWIDFDNIGDVFEAFMKLFPETSPGARERLAEQMGIATGEGESQSATPTRSEEDQSVTTPTT